MNPNFISIFVLLVISLLNIGRAYSLVSKKRTLCRLGISKTLSQETFMWSKMQFLGQRSMKVMWENWVNSAKNTKKLKTTPDPLNSKCLRFFLYVHLYSFIWSFILHFQKDRLILCLIFCNTFCFKAFCSWYGLPAAP